MHVGVEGSVMMLSSFPTAAARATAGLRRSPDMGPKEQPAATMTPQTKYPWNCCRGVLVVAMHRTTKHRKNVPKTFAKKA